MQNENIREWEGNNKLAYRTKIKDDPHRNSCLQAPLFRRPLSKIFLAL